MAEAARSSVYTLPFGSDLCETTVDLVLKTCGDDPLSLTEAIIFLPNNRAIRAMNEAFVRRAQGGLLMPRMVAIGDLALDESLGPLLDPLEGGGDIPALVPPLQRQLMLADMVMKQREIAGQRVDATEAMRLARLLAALIDEIDIEQIELSDFEKIAGDRDIEGDPNLAAHWQASYAGLLAILPEYRAKMADLGMDGAAARRNLLLARLEARLKETPPVQPVFASGISTAAPAIAKLVKRIALLPDGHVILPPLDIDMAGEDWEALGPPEQVDGELPKLGKETHPQYHLKLLIDRMGVNRAEIARLEGDGRPSASAIPQIFCLPEASVNWTALPDKAKKIPGLRIAVAEDSAEEARAIAILVREGLEQPEKRIAIATPDRELAVRISEQLKRWNIHVDDSAGQPLLQTPGGTLLMALLKAVADRFSPVSLLAIAKHPLVQPGEGRLDWLKMARRFDLELRGPSSGVGLNAATRRLSAELQAAKKPERISELKALIGWWEGFSAILAPIDEAASAGLSPLLEKLAECADKLSLGQIWKGVAGRQAAGLFDEFTAQNFAPLGAVKREALPELFAELCAGQVVRPPYGGHPRVALLGLLEARLQRADLLICAGLNEGSWPQLPQPDPWLAPRIRRQLGLPGLERNIGLSAHDLATALGAQECVVTRAKRDRSGPSVSSRFLLRIEAFLGDGRQVEERAIALARQIDAGEKLPFAKAPEIKPDAARRKVDLSVTDFDKLMADPFAFYGRKILRVAPLDDVDEEPGDRWRGTMIHDLLEKWAKKDGCVPEKLIQRAEAMLTDAELHPNLRALWQPRITEGLQWIAEETSELLAGGRSLAGAEIKGSVMLAGIKVKGRADRIDRDGDGNLVIIDYKKGKPPALKQIRAGFALQLGLLGDMAEQGAFKDVDGKAISFEYWSLAKESGEFGKRKMAEGGRGDDALAADELAGWMRERAIAAIEKWINGDAAFEAKLHPEYAPYSDFDQLSRLQEWDGRQGADKGTDKTPQKGGEQ
ncbi:MAG: double-strand break repair protein AddB [Sphingorhabdus sp.]